MPDLNVVLQLERLRCIDEGDGWGSAEPFLWTAFFTIDAEVLTTGRPRVVTHTGDHGNLPNHDVDAGETVTIPAGIGRFATLLKTLPLPGRENESRVGCVFALLEEDNTPAHAIRKGHEKFNAEVAAQLQTLMLKAATGQAPTQAEINAAAAEVSNKVKAAVKNDLSFFEKLRNQDDVIGYGVLMFSLGELLQAGTAGIRFTRRFKQEGDWELSGRVTGTPA